ncbi:MAG TPA: hypothetical protein VF847_03905 [Candidatus Deferrimicrobiaceae bacterium]
MGKSILQRLAGYVRDLNLTGTANPRPGGERPDGGRGRLSAVGRGKGEGNRGGDDPVKPCAVIGIPYSSDAVGKTEPEEEESAMKTIAKYMFTAVVFAAAAMILAAGGGG